MVLSSKAFLFAKTETITALAGCLPIDFRTKELTLTRYLMRGRPDSWPPLNNLKSHKINEHTYYTDSQANYVFRNSLSSSNTINEIRKALRINLYMRWYELFCQAVKAWTLQFFTDHSGLFTLQKLLLIIDWHKLLLVSVN